MFYCKTWDHLSNKVALQRIKNNDWLKNLHNKIWPYLKKVILITSIIHIFHYRATWPIWLDAETIMNRWSDNFFFWKKLLYQKNFKSFSTRNFGGFGRETLKLLYQKASLLTWMLHTADLWLNISIWNIILMNIIVTMTTCCI